MDALARDFVCVGLENLADEEVFKVECPCWHVCACRHLVSILSCNFLCAPSVSRSQSESRRVLIALGFIPQGDVRLNFTFTRSLRLALAGVTLALSVSAIAQEKKPEAQPGATQQKSFEPERENPDARSHEPGNEGDHAAANKPVPPETTSVTHHEMSLNGQAIHYTATAGNLIIKDEQEKPYGSIF